MRIIQKIWNWLVVSSADPSRISLTIKGIGVAIIPYLMIITNTSGVQIGSTEITSLFDTLAMIVQNFLTIVSGIMFVYGLVRKIRNTI